MPDPFPGPLSPDVRADPYPCYRWLLAERPVYHDPIVGYWALSRYGDVTAAARNFTDFSSAHGAGMSKRKGQTMLASDPPDHTRLRKLVNHAFRPGVVEALAPRIEAICHELIDTSAAARGSFELVEDFAGPLPVIVIADLLGFDPSGRNDYRRWSRALIAVFSNPDSVQANREYSRTAPEFLTYLAGVAQARMRSPRGDLVSLLLQAREERDALSLPEIAFSCELFLAAGNETTSSLIGNAALALAANPCEAEQVIRNPELIPSCIEEAIRFDPPVQADFRTTTARMTLHGIEVPSGAKVALLWAAANRDPEVFPEPGRFLVTRSPNPHVGFGHGVHYCLGAPLARMQARIAAKVLMERFRYLAPDPAVAVERNLATSLFRGLRRLAMSFELR